MTATPEYHIQVAVAQYLNARGLLWFHPANERRCTPQQGARLKRAGVKPGVPDILVFERTRGGMKGLVIELKAPGGYPTAEQGAWLDALEDRGWMVIVCRSVEEAIAQIDRCYPPALDRRAGDR